MSEPKWTHVITSVRYSGHQRFVGRRFRPCSTNEAEQRAGWNGIEIYGRGLAPNGEPWLHLDGYIDIDEKAPYNYGWCVMGATVREIEDSPAEPPDDPSWDDEE